MLDWSDYAAHSLALKEALKEAEAALARVQKEYNILHATIVQLRMAEFDDLFPELKEG